MSPEHEWGDHIMRGAGAMASFVKELGAGLLATLLFTLGLPDPVGAARAILTQGNLRLFLWLTPDKPIDPNP